MDTTNLRNILLEEMAKYAGEGLNAESYLMENRAESIYTIIDIAQVRGRRIIGIVLVARIEDNEVIIELDNNNKLLADALIARGISETQIMRAYETPSLQAQ